jgi:hypothetical protein
VGLGGGSNVGSAVALGVYAGGPTAVTIPADPFIPTATVNATVLLFVAHGVNASTLYIGSVGGALRELHLVPLSPLSSNVSVSLGGEFFSLKAETVRLTVKTEAGAVVSSQLLWKEGQTGHRQWNASLGQWKEIDRPTLVFEKVAIGDRMALVDTRKHRDS